MTLQKKYLVLSIGTLVTSFMFGASASLIHDLHLPYTSLAHFFGIKALVAGVVSLVCLVNYFWSNP